MVYRTVRSTGTNVNRWTKPGRRTARLSDGTYVAIAFEGSSAAPTWNLYWSADSTTWVFKDSVSAGNVIPGCRPQASICVDDSNNVHLVYMIFSTVDAAVPGWQYVKFTYTAGTPTFANSNGIVLRASSSGWTGVANGDIDFVGNGAGGRPIVCVHGHTPGGTASLNYWLINGATAVALTGITQTSTKPNYGIGKYGGHGQFGAIAGRHITETDGTLTFAYMIFDAGGAATLGVGIANCTNTGTGLTTHSGALTLVSATTVRAFTSADREITFAYMQDTGPNVAFARMHWNSSFVATKDFSLSTPMTAPTTTNLALWRWDAAAIDRNNYVILFPGPNGAGFVSAIYVDVSTGTSMVTAGVFTFENFNNFPPHPSIWSISAGFNKNIESGRNAPVPLVDISGEGSSTLAAGTIAVRTPQMVTGLAPVDGATINTDTPALSVNLLNDPSGNQSQYYVNWQFALNPGFTSGLINTFSAYGNGGSTFHKVLELLNKLTTQGTWYFRARAVNKYNVVGPWTATQTINDSHTPQSSNLVPNSDIALVFGAGVVSFSWTFVDTSPTATQSAYQIKITDTTTNTVVSNTGKVSSTQGAATVSVGAIYKDLPLVWTLTLWDDDDFQGAESLPQGFYVTDGPVPVITTPVDASTVTSSLVSINWNSGVAGAKTQIKYRLVIQKGVDVVFDTGTVSSAATSIMVPTGIIHTDGSYLITLQITDNLGVVGTGISTFNSDFISPETPDEVLVYGYTYQTLGYVWIGWDSANIDPDFIFWNLYRRAAGESDWTLLTTVTQSMPTYGYPDYTANSNVSYEYAVTQVVNRAQAGDILESDFTAITKVVFDGDYYWLVDSANLVPAVPLYQISADSYTDETERATYTVIGRGRKNEEGEHLGLTGALTCQLRDKSMLDKPILNVISDPSFQDNIPLSPEWVYSSTDTTTYTSLAYLEPPPSGHQNALKVDAVPNTAVTFSQTPAELPFEEFADRFHFSVWIANIDNASTFDIEATVLFKNAANATLATQTFDLVAFDDKPGVGNWTRYGSSRAVPVADTDHIDVSFKITDAGATGLSLLVTAVQMSPGATASIYTDGDLFGSQWNGVPLKSASHTTGFYTARAQRQAIVAMARLGRALNLRTPFGDTFRVTLGDTALARIAGTGADSELGEFTIPYSEVAV